MALKNSSTALGWLGISTSLGLAAFLTESFKNIGPVTGSNIRSVATMLSIVTFGFAVNSSVRWFKKIKTHNTPEGIVDGLTMSDTLDLKQLESVLARVQNRINNRIDKKGA